MLKKIYNFLYCLWMHKAIKEETEDAIISHWLRMGFSLKKKMNMEIIKKDWDWFGNPGDEIPTWPGDKKIEMILKKMQVNGEIYEDRDPEKSGTYSTKEIVELYEKRSGVPIVNANNMAYRPSQTLKEGNNGC